MKMVIVKLCAYFIKLDKRVVSEVNSTIVELTHDLALSIN